MPVMNDLVPSIGSSTQTYSAFDALVAVFLADDAVRREVLLDQRAHRVLGRAVRRRHRIEARPPSPCPRRRARCGRTAGSPRPTRSQAGRRRRRNRWRSWKCSSGGSRGLIGDRAHGATACGLRACANAYVRGPSRPVRGGRPESNRMHSPAGPSAPRGVVAARRRRSAAIYLVSQFLRNSVGVIAPDLAAEIGLNRPARSACCRARSSSPSRPRRFRSASRSTATGRSAACWSARRSRSLGTLAVRGRHHAGRPDRRARPDGARIVLLSDGAARALCAPLSARAVHACSPASRSRSAPSARCS